MIEKWAELIRKIRGIETLRYREDRSEKSETLSVKIRAEISRAEEKMEIVLVLRSRFNLFSCCDDT